METKQWVVVGTQVPRKRLSGDDLVEHPANRGATGISALNAKANDPTCEHVHHHHDPMAAQKYRFAAKQIDAPQAVLHMPDQAQPGRTICSCFGSICFASARRTMSLSISMPKARAISCAMRGQPTRGLRRLNSTIASMSSFDGPFGPGRR